MSVPIKKLTFTWSYVSLYVTDLYSGVFVMNASPLWPWSNYDGVKRMHHRSHQTRLNCVWLASLSMTKPWLFLMALLVPKWTICTQTPNIDRLQRRNSCLKNMLVLLFYLCISRPGRILTREAYRTLMEKHSDYPQSIWYYSGLPFRNLFQKAGYPNCQCSGSCFLGNNPKGVARIYDLPPRNRAIYI